MRFLLRLKGGPGSGHRGHAGRPGEVGGSAPGLTKRQQRMWNKVVAGKPLTAKQQPVWDKITARVNAGELPELEGQFRALTGTSNRVESTGLIPEAVNTSTDTGLREEVAAWGEDRGEMAEYTVAWMESSDNDSPNTGGIIFRDGNEVVGVMAHKRVVRVGEVRLHLELFATKRPGVGRAAMQHLGQVAAGVGASKVELFPTPESFGFYDKLGMTVSPIDSPVPLYELGVDAMIGVRGIKEFIPDDEPPNGVFTMPPSKKPMVVILKCKGIDIDDGDEL